MRDGWTEGIGRKRSQSGSFLQPVTLSFAFLLFTPVQEKDVQFFQGADLGDRGEGVAADRADQVLSGHPAGGYELLIPLPRAAEEAVKEVVCPQAAEVGVHFPQGTQEDARHC